MLLERAERRQDNSPKQYLSRYGPAEPLPDNALRGDRPAPNAAWSVHVRMRNDRGDERRIVCPFRCICRQTSATGRSLQRERDGDNDGGTEKEAGRHDRLRVL